MLCRNIWPTAFFSRFNRYFHARCFLPFLRLYFNLYRFINSFWTVFGTSDQNIDAVVISENYHIINNISVIHEIRIIKTRWNSQRNSKILKQRAWIIAKLIYTWHLKTLLSKIWRSERVKNHIYDFYKKKLKNHSITSINHSFCSDKKKTNFTNCGASPIRNLFQFDTKVKNVYENTLFHFTLYFGLFNIKNFFYNIIVQNASISPLACYNIYLPYIRIMVYYNIKTCIINA